MTGVPAAHLAGSPAAASAAGALRCAAISGCGEGDAADSVPAWASRSALLRRQAFFSCGFRQVLHCMQRALRGRLPLLVPPDERGRCCACSAKERYCQTPYKNLPINPAVAARAHTHHAAQWLPVATHAEDGQYGSRGAHRLRMGGCMQRCMRCCGSTAAEGGRHGLVEGAL